MGKNIKNELQSMGSNDQSLFKEAELTPKVKELSNEISFEDADSISEFGAKAQEQLDTIAKSAIDHISSRDTGAIGSQLKDLNVILQENDSIQDLHPSLFKRLLHKGKHTLLEVQASYQTVASNIDKISGSLGKERELLLDDNRTLQQLYEDNISYNRSVSEYIRAGEYKLKQFDEDVLPKVKKEIDKTDPLSAQRYQNALSFRDRLDKRIHDLKLVRQVSVQQAPQIAMMRSANQVLSDKINQTIQTAVPLWRQQTAIYLSMERQQQAVRAQKAAADTTNKLLLENSNLLKVSSLQVAKESSRGIVDISTLKKTQQNLVNTVSGVLQIEQDNANKRVQASKDLKQMNEDMIKQLKSAQSRRVIHAEEEDPKERLKLTVDKNTKPGDMDFM